MLETHFLEEGDRAKVPWFQCIVDQRARAQPGPTRQRKYNQEDRSLEKFLGELDWRGLHHLMGGLKPYPDVQKKLLKILI